MKYALVCDRVWKVSGDDSFGNEVFFSRGDQVAKIALRDTTFISVEEEAGKLLKQCEPYVNIMHEFSDINHLKGIDSNELLPFTDNFSSIDNELLDFLNETIGLVNKKIISRSW